MDEVIAHAEGVSIGKRPEISFEKIVNTLEKGTKRKPRLCVRIPPVLEARGKWFGAACLAITLST
jgi:hypothetical protein